jgi:sterol desaturase/sphingolipid hydroxylase (fatty acid hydroxylase superfamily)
VSTFWSVIVASTALGVINALLLAWELRISRRRGRSIATRGWTLSNLGCGVLRTLSVATIQGPVLALYAWVASGVSWTWPIAWWTWIAGFVAIDLAEYLSHRASHERPFLWAIHAVHHQSPEYNMSLNFRLGVLGPATTLPFHLMLALAGMPPVMFAILVAVQAAGMMLTHSRYPGTLGPLGYVLNAPAWHRVHHSAVQAHRDLNYGAVLIVWDRLFGTFTDGSQVAPRWGVDGEPATRSPIASNISPWQSLATRVRSSGWIALWRW